MNKLLMVTSVVLSTAASSAMADWGVTFIVRPEAEAIVERGGEIVRVERAGLHFYNPFLEEFKIYIVAAEREYAFEQPFQIANDPVHVTIVYKIDDVVAWHEAEADLTPLPALRQPIQDAFDRLARTDAPESVIHQVFEDANIPGLQIIRSGVEFEGDDLPPPRIVTRERLLPGLETLQPLGGKRLPPLSFEVILHDDRILMLENVIVTYDILDEDLVWTCFGDGAVDRRLELAFIAATRQELGNVSLEEIALAQGRIPTRFENISGLARNCGLQIGHADFGQSTLKQLIRLNCDEAPGEVECN